MSQAQSGFGDAVDRSDRIGFSCSGELAGSVTGATRRGIV